MKNSTATPDQGLDISGTERETGLSKDLLRMWERRYGFPKPMRGENGERRYSGPEEVRRAALAHEADIVALSFSGAYPVRKAVGELAALRRALPSARTIWAGGGMTGRLPKPVAGVVLLPDLGAAIAALQRWRHGGEAGEAALVTPLGELTGTASAAEPMAATGSV